MMICYISGAAKCWIIGLGRVVHVHWCHSITNLHFSPENSDFIFIIIIIFWFRNSHSSYFILKSLSLFITVALLYNVNSTFVSQNQISFIIAQLGTEQCPLFNFNLSWFLFLSIMQLKQKVAFCHRGVLIYRHLFYEEYFFSLTKTSYQTCHNPSAMLKGQVDVCLFLFREGGQFSWFC